MTIRFQNGFSIEAVLLSSAGAFMRVAVQGSDDPMEFRNLNGLWVSEDLEPVRICFEWQKPTRREIVSESDCICPKELADKLISHLYGDAGEEVAVAASAAA